MIGPRTVVVAIVAVVTGYLPAVRAERHPFTHITTADGLASSHVLNVRRDTQGFLWIGTRGGLTRFDGTRFTTFGVADGLPIEAVTDVLDAHDGSFWIATNGAGVIRIARNEARGRRVPIAGSASSQRVNRLIEDGRHRVWAATDEGVFRVDAPPAGVFAPVFTRDPRQPFHDAAAATVVLDHRGDVWTAITALGAYRFRADGRIDRYAMEDGLPPGRVITLIEDRARTIWIGTEQGLCRLRPRGDDGYEVARVYGTKDGLPPFTVWGLLESADGALWVSTGGGLARFDGERFYTYRLHTRNRLSYGALVEDVAGDIWAGTDTGVIKLNRRGFITYDDEDSPGLGKVHRIVSSPDGALYALGDGWRVSRLDARGAHAAGRLPVPDAANSPVDWTWLAQGALIDRHGAWWALTSAGLVELPAGAGGVPSSSTRPRAIYRAADGLSDDHVYRAFEDSRGDLWIGTSSGIAGEARAATRLARLDRASGRLVIPSEADRVPAANPPTAFAEDWGGQIWIGFGNGGLLRYRHGRFETLAAATGQAPTNQQWPSGNVMSLFVDAQQRLWIGTGHEGLYRVDDPGAAAPRAVRYTTAEGLASNNIRCLVQDTRGRLYIGTARGVNRLDVTTGQVRHYSTADGLANDLVVTAARDADGSLWFGTHTGLSRLVPSDDPPPRRPPVFIDSVDIGGAALPISYQGASSLEGPAIEPGVVPLRIGFTALAFGFGQRPRFQYRLDADRDWSTPAADRVVTYANLAPGHYRFEVRGVDSDGVSSEQPAALTFTVMAPFWQRRAFLGAMAILIAGLAYTGYRLRMRQLLELERVRTRIATDLHDDLGGSLTRMVILSEVVRRQAGASREETVKRMGQIADTARSLVDALSDAVWAIDARSDTLAALVARLRSYASDLFDARRTACIFDVPPDLNDVHLSPDVRRHLFLIVKEALTNVARHAEASRVEVRLARAGRHLTVDVIDNGRGDTLPTPDASPTRGGRGRANMQSRAALLGGRVEITANASGTRVHVAVTLR